MLNKNVLNFLSRDHDYSEKDKWYKIQASDTLSVQNLDKGQLISKCLFGVFNSSKKMNEKIRLNYYDTSGRIVFVRFLEEIEDTKKNISKLTDL